MGVFTDYPPWAMKTQTWSWSPSEEQALEAFSADETSAAADSDIDDAEE